MQPGRDERFRSDAPGGSAWIAAGGHLRFYRRAGYGAPGPAHPHRQAPGVLQPLWAARVPHRLSLHDGRQCGRRIPRRPRIGKGDEGLIRTVTAMRRSEEHTSELQSRLHLVCRLLLEKKKKKHPIESNLTTIDNE